MNRRRRHERERSSFIPVSRLRLPVTAFVALVAFGLNGPVHATDGEICDTARVVASALPSTVNITVVKVVKGDDADNVRSSNERVEMAFGSGLIVDPSGMIVTNKHVIKDAVHIWVTFSDRSQVPALLIAAGGIVDLALLKVEVPTPLPVVKFADSDALRIGQPAIAVGNPLGLGTSVSTGVVSALNRDLMRSPFDDYVQTDASINPGNSGGALLNCAGELIGINTALVSNNKLLGSIGLGFALPSNDVDFVIHKLLSAKNASPTWVGMNLQDLTAQLALTFGRPNMAGAVVTNVEPDSPAAKAGIETGDIITAIDGLRMLDARGILRSIVSSPIGKPIAFSLRRDGATMDVTVIGQAWPHMLELRGDVLANPESVARAQSRGIGLHLIPVSVADRRRLIDQVVAGSQADTIGLKVGEVIEKVNGRSVTSPDDVITRYAYGDGDLKMRDVDALLVRGKDKTRWVSMFVGRVDVTDLLAQPPSIMTNSPAVQNAVGTSNSSQ